MDFDALLHARWSPRAFQADSLPAESIREVFEAVRWAQSSFNEQPWRYFVASRSDGSAREGLESLLMDGNAFAKEAWLLGVSYAKTTFARNGNPNRCALHDLGAANQLLALRAWDLGLQTRFMAGFDVEGARALAPEGSDFEPVAMFALGHATPEALEQGPGDRGRREAVESVFHGEWGSAPAGD